MTDTLANNYSSQIISTISTLEDELGHIHQSQNELMNAIAKAQELSITEKDLQEIKAMMDHVSIYNTKLLQLKATMSMLTGRSKQLLTKANKLKQVKMQYMSQIDIIRKMEQEKDLSIAAKPSTSLSSTPISSPALTSSPVNTACTSTTATTTTIAAASNNTTTSIPKVKSVIKKKKKSKAREALIGDDNEDNGNWAPKRSISHNLTIKKT